MVSRLSFQLSRTFSFTYKNNPQTPKKTSPLMLSVFISIRYVKKSENEPIDVKIHFLNDLHRKKAIFSRNMNGCKQSLFPFARRKRHNNIPRLSPINSTNSKMSQHVIYVNYLRRLKAGTKFSKFA